VTLNPSREPHSTSQIADQYRLLEYNLHLLREKIAATPDLGGRAALFNRRLSAMLRTVDKR
jgi:hypothetical protein